MWGHMHSREQPPSYPQFFEKAEGCHIYDVDGNEYVDFMCSWGPIILGHRHPAVEEATARQFSRGDCMNGPSESLVELAELITDLVPHADWAMFQKNGTDATTTCVTIARAATSRRKLLVAAGAYHGAVPWCSPSLLGITAEDRAHIVQYEYNDLASVESALEHAGDDLAGILVSPFRHDLGRDQELAKPEFAAGLRTLCHERSAALILDDVRAGFRLGLGGSWESLGIRPDLSAWSKAMANGYPLAAVTGRDWLREAASNIFVTGSFWCGAVAMAAAVATLNELRSSDAVATMTATGTRLREGLATLASRHGVGMRQTGPVQMPLILFDDDADFAKGELFCSVALAQGVYFHPKHNMFMSAAHTDKDIDRALTAADAGLSAVAERM
ncbi:MAG: aminotransferase class III-fold pyridoxal phosphate-dependent enzyme [Bauldia sp.]|nr:aminotransferase class III-fold pyridoxal phosphate-dependent enzyme [Bauldia sp.]